MTLRLVQNRPGAGGGPAADEVLRAFVAVEINAGVRAQLAQVLERLRAVGARVGWVAPENIHLTLVFLGNVFRAQVAGLGEALDRAAAGCPAFEFQVGGLGYFGAPQAPRVVWAGVAEQPALEALQRAAAAAVAAAGIRLEERPFKAHLTLGRVRSRQGADALTSALCSTTNTAFGSVPVRRMLFMRSELGHQGVRYSVLHESLLKGA